MDCVVYLVFKFREILFRQQFDWSPSGKVSLTLIESWEPLSPLKERFDRSQSSKSYMNLQYTMVDSTIDVSNVTALVIPMEVPVDKPTHYPQQSSDSMV